MRKSGSALLIVIMVASVLMTLAVILTRIVYNYSVSEALAAEREKAFWLAEAGLEAGKVELARDPGWYTDLPSGPPVGHAGSLPSGSYQLVRVKDQNALSAVGRSGRTKVALEITFSTGPFKTLSWSQI